MSRWLWALLGGVVLVAIAAFFWTASNQTNVTTPVSPGPTPVARAPAPASTAQRAAPSPPSSPAPPAAQEAAAPPAPAPTAPSAPTPAPNAGQHAASPPAPAPPPETPSAAPVVAHEPPSAPAPLAEPPLPPPAPGREASDVAGVYAPKSLAQLVGTWAYSAEDCERLFQRRGGGWAYRQPVDKFAQAAIVEFAEEDPSAFRHLPDRSRV